MIRQHFACNKMKNVLKYSFLLKFYQMKVFWLQYVKIDFKSSFLLRSDNILLVELKFSFLWLFYQIALIRQYFAYNLWKFRLIPFLWQFYQIFSIRQYFVWKMLEIVFKSSSLLTISDRFSWNTYAKIGLKSSGVW